MTRAKIKEDNGKGITKIDDKQHQPTGIGEDYEKTKGKPPFTLEGRAQVVVTF